MNVLADHCLPERFVDALRKAGRHVDRVVDLVSPRASDQDVAELARRLDAILVTADTDFLRRKVFQPRRYPGIVVVLTRDMERAADRIERRLVRAIDRADLRGAVLLLDARSARIRR